MAYPPEFYKKFRYLLTPFLMDVMDQSRHDKCFPDTFSNAIISVIYKKGKDPLQCTHFLIKTIK